MSTPRSLYKDPRNAITVDNNDPKAQDKSHAGTAGSHTEYACCDYKPAQIDAKSITPFYMVNGVKVDVVDYWGSSAWAADRKARGVEGGGANGWWNAETPPGLSIGTDVVMWSEADGPEYWNHVWCDRCATALEDVRDELGSGVVAAVDAISIVASYVPVIGTAISFILNMAVNLAEGEKLENAALSAIGHALPGQPLSGMAFDAAVAIILGEQPNEVIVAALPDPPASPVIKKSLVAASDIVISVANGETVANATLDELEKNLPPRAAQVVNIARRMASGENVEAIAVDVLGHEAATAMAHAAAVASQAGSGAVSRFVSEAAFQSVADMLPAEMNGALKAGFTAAIAKKMQDQMESNGFTAKESPSAATTNDALAAKGQKLMSQGITWLNSAGKPVRVQDLRNGHSLTLNMLVLDTMSQTTSRQVITDAIDDTWRRGFDVAIGLCEGNSADGPGQQRVRASLTLLQAEKGFDMGQQIQFDRTAQARFLNMHAVQNATVSKSFANSPVQRLLQGAAPTLTASAGPAFVSVEERRAQARSAWVAHYEQLAAQTNGKMTG